jgi:hypothetical protein
MKQILCHAFRYSTEPKRLVGPFPHSSSVVSCLGDRNRPSPFERGGCQVAGWRGTASAAAFFSAASRARTTAVRYVTGPEACIIIARSDMAVAWCSSVPQCLRKVGFETPSTRAIGAVLVARPAGDDRRGVGEQQHGRH